MFIRISVNIELSSHLFRIKRLHHALRNVIHLLSSESFEFYTWTMHTQDKLYSIALMRRASQFYERVCLSHIVHETTCLNGWQRCWCILNIITKRLEFMHSCQLKASSRTQTCADSPAHTATPSRDCYSFFRPTRLTTAVCLRVHSISLQFDKIIIYPIFVCICDEPVLLPLLLVLLLLDRCRCMFGYILNESSTRARVCVHQPQRDQN